MKLTGQQHRQLREAIQSAFVDIADLKIMLREEMDMSLNNIASGENDNQIVSNLINQLEAQNRIVEFLEAALKSVPKNQELLNYQQQFIQESKSPPTEPITNIPEIWFQDLTIITINSSIITLICIIIKFLGILQPYELWAFDRLIQIRGSLQPDKADHRILIVGVTPEEREEWDKVEKPYRASLPDKVILELLQKLDEYNPKTIGISISRPFNATEDELAKKLSNDSRLFAVCKVPVENGNKVAPPPEVPENRLGFSDFIQDPDQVLRRYLFQMNLKLTPDDKKRLGIKEDENFCQANYALSFQLALHYLGEKAQFTEKGFYKIRDVVFKPLDGYAGPYQRNIDLGGHQIILDYHNFHGFFENSPRNVAEQLTLNQVIQDRVATEDIQRYQNRIILIGIITRGQENYWSTPLGGREVPGVFIHAQMVSQILRAVEDGEPLLWYWPQWVEILWIWVWATVGGTIVWCNHQPKYMLVMEIAGIISVVNICIFVFFLFNGWLPSIPPIIALIFTALIIFYTQNFTVKSK